MSNDTRATHAARGKWRLVLTLLLGVAAYCLLDEFFAAAMERNMLDAEEIRRTFYPVFGLAVGFFVGVRHPRFGWAYAAVPISIYMGCTSALLASTDYLVLDYHYPIQVFCSVLGAVIGTRGQK